MLEPARSLEAARAREHSTTLELMLVCRRSLLSTGAAALALSLCVAAPARAETHAVSVHLQHTLAVAHNVHLGFRARALPQGGYYYAVIVLKPYGKYTRASPPPCATSSDMQRTDYGYPRSDGRVALTLTPVSSRTGHWCRGGSYVGAIYAVPHRPPCEGTYPCGSEPYERPSPCWHAGGHVVCGVVALPKRYAYPDGLPRALASGTTIAGRFSVTFPR
jgi:hypothetical protein